MIYANQLLRMIALILLSLRYLYWIFAEIKSHNIKHKTVAMDFFSLLKKFGVTSLGGLLFIQLIGVEILPFDSNIVIQTFGFFIFLISIFIMFIARIQLGANWAHAADYQIKEDHSLVKTGIYKFIRHPIYAGFMFSFLGVELLVSSYLFYIFLLILPIISYQQAKKEESLLESYFKKDYQEYKKTSKMFVPFLI